MDFPSHRLLSTLQSWHFDAEPSRGSPFHSLNADARRRAFPRAAGAGLVVALWAQDALVGDYHRRGPALLVPVGVYCLVRRFDYASSLARCLGEAGVT